MAEGYALRVATVLAAETQLEAGVGRPALLRGDVYQPAYACFVERGKRVLRKEGVLQVEPEEFLLRVVPAEAERHLGEDV